MNKNDNKLSTGYVNYSKSKKSAIFTEDNELPNSQDLKNDKPKKLRYPKGYASVVLITLITIAIFLLCFLIKKNYPITRWETSNGDVKLSYYLSLQNSLTVAFSVAVLLHFMWLISRQNFSLKSKFTGRQFLDILTVKNFREKKNFVIKFSPIGSIKNFSEYQEYCWIKKKTTALVFYISSISYIVIFAIVLIITFTTSPVTIG